MIVKSYEKLDKLLQEARMELDEIPTDGNCTKKAIKLNGIIIRLMMFLQEEMRRV